MPAQDPAAALSSLLRASTITDHEEALRTATAAVKLNKLDQTAQHTRVVALLKLDRFEDALRVIAEGGVRVDTTCALEKAYALYKTGNLDAATLALQGIGIEKKSHSHVAAQVAYRAEKFDEAQAIYKRILDTNPGDEEHDLHINFKAAFAQSQWLSYSHSSSYPDSLASHDQSPDAFELHFNDACASIAAGHLDAAAALLQRAMSLCDASDELSQEDKQAEIQPILAQQAYVSARTGKLKEALQLYQSLGHTVGSDPDLTVIAENNLATLDPKPANPFLLQRKSASWAQGPNEAKLFHYQSKLLDRNLLVIDLQSRKIQGVKRRTEKVLSEAAHPTISADINILSVLNAAAEIHGVTGKGILGKISALSTKRPKDVGLVLTIIQVQIQSGQPGAALAVLESFLSRLDDSDKPEDTDVRFSPGLVGLAVSLMRTQGRQTSAKAELVKAARYWQDRQAGAASSVLREAGIELLRSSNPEDLKLAGAAFEKLFDEMQGSHIAEAGLVASLAPSDPAKVQQYVSRLPPVEDLLRDVNVQELVNAGVAAVPRTASNTGKRAAAPDKTSDRPAKKRRKGKLPNSYEEGKPEDPERWLPLRDRSTYRPKGKKGKKKAADSTQGGMVKEEETLELVGGGGVKVERASGNAPSNKKKKKGKK